MGAYLCYHSIYTCVYLPCVFVPLIVHKFEWPTSFTIHHSIAVLCACSGTLLRRRRRRLWSRLGSMSLTGSSLQKRWQLAWLAYISTTQYWYSGLIPSPYSQLFNVWCSIDWGIKPPRISLGLHSSTVLVSPRCSPNFQYKYSDFSAFCGSLQKAPYTLNEVTLITC